MKVKGNHPLTEIIAKKLFGISTVPIIEKERMINRACKAVVDYHNKSMFTEKEIRILLCDIHPPKKDFGKGNEKFTEMWREGCLKISIAETIVKAQKEKQNE